MSITQRLQELGLTLPPSPTAVGSYVPAVHTGRLVFTAGQLPRGEGGLVTGKVGGDISVEQGQEAARTAALNALAAVAGLLGDLEGVVRVVKVTGYVNSAPGFTGQPQVLNGASDLLRAIFGERGQHARSAVGVSELPLDAAVEVELVVEVGEAGA